jgi:hypothetical protein
MRITFGDFCRAGAGLAEPAASAKAEVMPGSAKDAVSDLTKSLLSNGIAGTFLCGAEYYAAG